MSDLLELLLIDPPLYCMHNSAKMTQSHGVVVRMRRPSLKHPPDLLPPLDHRGRGEALEEELAVLLGQDAAVQE